MSSSTTVSGEASSVFDKYVSETVQVSRNRQTYIATDFVRQCTAALTLLSALTGFGLAGGTAAVAGAATQLPLPPVQVWRSSRAAMAQSEINLLIHRLDRLKQYRAGWAGPGSLVPTKKAFMVAGDFIYYLAEAGMRAPNRINLSSDGEINFYWKQNGGTLDIGFNRRSNSSYYARLPNGAAYIQNSMHGMPRLRPDIIAAFALG
ncbi:MAG: hypothetical protein ACK4U0_06790 [Mesorhizobium sp.]